jgi:hypothetical protein
MSPDVSGQGTPAHTGWQSFFIIPAKRLCRNNGVVKKVVMPA